MTCCLVYLAAEADQRIKGFIVDTGMAPSENGAVAFGAQALEPSFVVRLRLRWVRHQLSNDAELQRAYGQLIGWVRQRTSRGEQSLLCDSATERLQAIRKLAPDLVCRLPQGEVAR